MTTAQPHLRFGVIADVQYVNCDDGSNFLKTVIRRYRRSLESFHSAIECWNALTANHNQITFIAQLGDLIDGLATSRGSRDSDFARLAQELDGSLSPWCHVIGNHELMNYSREELSKAHPSFASAVTVRQGRYCGYRDFSPHPKWRVVVLDAYDLSILGYPKADPHYEMAKEILSKNNPNNLENGTNWLEGLEGIEERFGPGSGAIGPAQMEWLKATLADASLLGQRVVVLSHVPMLPGTCYDECLLWNFEEVLDVLAAQGNVQLVLVGHNHAPGSGERDGITHITVPTPLESTDSVCHGVVELWETHISVVGYGAMGSFRIPLK
eukprot:c10312_g1_i2.p1 GENE.c10312_g1_i2~~c10312_g1_i2.p1  ORF type:complete len:335 (+),score=68.34 c10312_g1_i2:32-1006(+)